MAKRTMALIATAAIVFITANLSAQVFFIDDVDGQNGNDQGYIDDGAYYEYAYADETSVIDVTGGIADLTELFEGSTANISGGQLWELWAFDESIVNVAGSGIGNLYGTDQGTISITGGQVEWLSISFDSQATIVNGAVANIWAEDSSIADITGYSLSYDPQFHYDGARGVWEGLLTGYWEDETPFNIKTWDEATYGHLVLNDLGPLPSVPEPATLLLLGLGGLVLRRKSIA